MTCRAGPIELSPTLPMEMIMMGAVAGIFLIVIVRMLNSILESRKLSTWAEIEMGYVINSLLFLLLFSSAVAFLLSPSSSQVVNNLFLLTYGKDVPSLLGNFGDVFREDVCIYQNTYSIFVLILSELVKMKQATLWGHTMYSMAASQEIRVSGPVAIPQVLGFPLIIPGFIQGATYSYQPYLSAGEIAKTFLSGSTETYSIVNVSFNLLAFLLLVGPFGFSLITIGFILRMIPPLKDLGASFAALGIAFSIFFPLLLVGEGVIMLANQQPFHFSDVSDEPQLIEEFKTSLEEVVGRGTITAFELGLITEPLLFVDGQQNLKGLKKAGSVQEITLFKLKEYLERSSRLALYGSIVAPFNFILVIVMVSSIMKFLGENESILDFFLINYR